MNSINRSKKPDTTITKFPCKLCPKNVSNNDNAISCDLCQTWVHIKCNQCNLIILIENIYKIIANQGIFSLVPQCSFHFVI